MLWQLELKTSTDPAWTVMGDDANGNDFGYRNSANAGGSAGEAGGRFTRSDFVRYYADTNIGGTLTLNEALGASGLFDFTQRSTPDFGQPFVIGHFDSTAENRENKLGLMFNNGDNVGELSWGIVIRFGDGSKLESSTSIISSNVDRTWQYSWNPGGGAFKAGQLIGTLSGPGGGTLVLDVPIELRSIGASFDAFGLNGGFPEPPTPIAGNSADIFIDDVSYSVVAAVPEPASFAIWGVGTIAFGLLIRGRSERNRGNRGHF